MKRALAMIAVLLAACSAPPDMAGLAGSYVMSIDIDTLRLGADGTYRRTHVVLSRPPRIRVDSGKWTVMLDGRLVALRDLRSRWPEHGRYDPKDGSWHSPDTSVVRTVSLTVERTWTGKLELGVRPEIGWKYVRLASEP